MLRVASGYRYGLCYLLRQKRSLQRGSTSGRKVGWLDTAFPAAILIMAGDRLKDYKRPRKKVKRVRSPASAGIPGPSPCIIRRVGFSAPRLDRALGNEWLIESREERRRRAAALQPGSFNRNDANPRLKLLISTKLGIIFASFGNWTDVFSTKAHNECRYRKTGR